MPTFFFYQIAVDPLSTAKDYFLVALAVSATAYSIWRFFSKKRLETEAQETKRANTSENLAKTLEAKIENLEHLFLEKEAIERAKSAENISLTTEIKMIAAINQKELCDFDGIVRRLKLKYSEIIDEKDFEIAVLKNQLENANKRGNALKP